MALFGDIRLTAALELERQTALELSAAVMVQVARLSQLEQVLHTVGD